MRRYLSAAILLATLFSCKQNNNGTTASTSGKGSFNGMLDHYYSTRMQLFPLEATTNGDTLYNDRLEADFTDSYRAKLHDFFTAFKDSLSAYNRDQLNENDKLSFDILNYDLDMALEGQQYGYSGSSFAGSNTHFPFDQFNGVPINLGQIGAGSSWQPFKTEKDYNNWIRRASSFSAWTDSAIVYFKKGIVDGYVLPAALVSKMIPQMKAMVVANAEQSIFYTPVKNIPASFAAAVRDSLKSSYTALINNSLIPSYRRLADFLEKEYLPKARSTSGVNALPNGAAFYNYNVRYWTTTKKTPDEIYQTGLSEVARIRNIMETVKDSVGFKGDLNAFFNYMKTDRKFMPYKTPEEVLNAFHEIHHRMEPNLKRLYNVTPTTKFEIRQTEAFRAASASAEYNAGLPDNSRPGIFYVPILDATKFNTTSGMESLFLHEAIPGHHYQISLQNENKSLPKFRQFNWYGAYGEGYALYCESLGKELGLYTDPYQYMGALGDEIHRAIRLVVDVSIHTGKMTREQAIKYMMENEPISEEGATAEIERYMAYPAQALSYKTGAMKIRELRNKYQNQLGSKFSIANFHAALLKNGCMPLDVMERTMDEWAKGQ